jgi:hypothetical protein
MRTLALFICSALLASSALFVPLASPAWGAGPDWLLLDENQDSRFYYDQSGAKKPSEGVVQVRTRVVYTDEGKADALRILQGDKKLDNLFETRYLHELDCKKEQSRVREARHLDGEGVTLKLIDLSSVNEWEEIPPDARMALVQEKVCAPQPAQK